MIAVACQALGRNREPACASRTFENLRRFAFSLFSSQDGQGASNGLNSSSGGLKTEIIKSVRSHASANPETNSESTISPHGFRSVWTGFRSPPANSGTYFRYAEIFARRYK